MTTSHDHRRCASTCSVCYPTQNHPELILFTKEDLDAEFSESDNDITEFLYCKAEVKSGTWILYNAKDFNKALSDYIIITERGVKELPFSPGSVRLLSTNKCTKSVTVFQHANFGGEFKTYEKESKDVTEAFPIGKDTGVSSVIIWPGIDWKLFAGKAFKGPKKTLKPGRYPVVKEIPFPDGQLQSLCPC